METKRDKLFEELLDNQSQKRTLSSEERKD